MDDFERELKQGFLSEADQILVDLEQCFLTLESNGSDKGVLDRIFRLAHNIKGSSKAVGFDQLGRFAHEFENLLLKLKNGEVAISGAAVSLLLRSSDQLAVIVAGLKENLDAQFDLTDLTLELEQATHGQFRESSAATPEAEPASEPEFESSFQDAVPVPVAMEEDALLRAAAMFEAQEAPAAAQEAPTPAELVPVVAADAVAIERENSPPSPMQTIPLPVTSAAASPATPVAKVNAATMDESIRVSLQRVEKLLNFVGELSILQSVLVEQVYGSNPTLLKRTAHQMSKVVKEVQDISMSLRMVPVKQTFNKMQRIVRDTANTLDKKVILHLEGEDTELDKTVLEAIGDPLVHLVRNAVDHGVESGDVRLKNGKSETGNVYLRAFHQAGKLVIEVQDDGGGISGQKLIAKAIEKGLIRPGTTMNESDAVRLIFLAGFSTKAQVSEVSGRGVGMDVVKTNIEALQGEVHVRTELGKYTCFQIILPLTLAIIDAMVVQNGEDRFVVPLSHVHESIKVGAGDVHPATGVGEVIQLRGELLPAFRLSRLLSPNSKTAGREQIALVIRNQGPPFSILVDDIVRQQQVVVKRLGRELQASRGFSGSAILGDGRPALILETIDLLASRGAMPKGA
jgi:two-component system chemotaxis sensor kinase CheA